MKYFLFFLACLIPFTLKADPVCIEENIYSSVYSKLLLLDNLEKSIPKITFNTPIYLIVDEKDRIYSNASGQYLIPGKLEIGPLKYTLEVEVSLKIHKKIVPEYGFRYRPKLNVSWLIFNTLTNTDLLDMGVDFDFLYYKRYNLNAYIGARSFGVDVGADIFKNSGVSVGIRWLWPLSNNPLNISPIIGWYFSF